MKILRELVLLFMLSFVTPMVNAMSVIAVSPVGITLTIGTERQLRSRHRYRRFGYVPGERWEYCSL